MDFEISHRSQKGVCHIRISGEMSIYTALELKNKLLDIFYHITEVHSIEINLSEVDEIDTAGFQILVLMKNETARRHIALHLVAHSNAVLEIFSLFNVENFFGDPLVLPETA